MAEWYRQREVIEERRNRSTLEVGFAAFFLNRTNRSGIMRGGVIGGQKQTGKWKISARFTKKTLIGRIRAIAAFRDRIHIHNIDACDLLNKPMPKAKGRIFWYLDPPYYVKGQELYENHYTSSDHAQLVEFINDLKDPWIVSYDDVPEIRKLFRRHKHIAYGISYSVADHYGGKEVAFFSPRLRLPSIESPLSVSPTTVKKQVRAYLTKHPDQ